MRILFLSRWFPFPATNGAKIRIRNLLRTLAPRHRVTLFAFRDPGEREAAASELPFEAVRSVEWRPFVPDSGKALLGFLSLEPRSFKATYSPEMASLIRQAVGTGQIDLIIASEIQMAAYHDCFGDVPAIWEEAETGVYLQQLLEAPTAIARLRARLTWTKHCRFVRSLVPRFARCTVVSEPEREILAAIAPAHPPIDIIPNALPLDSYTGFQKHVDPAALVFAGALSFQPNWEGALWLVEKALPLIHAEVPEARLTILGNPGGRILPVRRNVTVAGEVPDVRPVVANSTLSVVPILSGGGTRLKILESMAIGTPVVTTSKGCEGLAVEAGREMLVADTPESFAAAVVSLLRDPDARQRLAAAAHRCFAANYDWNLMESRFLRLVEETALPGAPASPPAAAALHAG
jgi:polysaccharide biosynthesis protein PslH